MHEMAITQSMFDLVLEHAKRAEATRVERINLVIGEMTGVVGDCIQFYLDFLSKGTVVEGAQLTVTMVPTRTRCRDCNRTFELKPFDWTCPDCDGKSLDVIAGSELFVESIEVE